MKLQIRDTQGASLLPFLDECISPYFLDFIRAKFNRQILSNYQDLFDINEFEKILFGQNFLRTYTIGDFDFILDINPVLKVGDISFLDCCVAIDQGTLTTASYPIFTSAFISFQRNIWTYYKYFWRA